MYAQDVSVPARLQELYNLPYMYTTNGTDFSVAVFLFVYFPDVYKSLTRECSFSGQFSIRFTCVWFVLII